MSDEFSREDAKSRSLDVEEISAMVVDCGYRLHVEAGPGLLESVYEVALARLLMDRGLNVIRQSPIPIKLFNYEFNEGFRADLIINDCFLVELKSVEKLAPVHAKQTLTYLRLLGFPIGLLLNFGSSTFKEGCKRIVNNHTNFASSRLRVNQNAGNGGRND
jgi:iron complex transport system substrate-binding protein